jgi:hypothetical protein
LDGKKLLSTIVDNWPAKVLAIGLAVVLFVFHRMSTLESRFFSVPLNIENLGAMMPSSTFSRMVRVSLRGEANSIFPIMEDDIEVYIDMGRFSRPGTYIVPVQWRKKGTALGVEPLQITVDPMEISISLDHRISKFVPIAVSFRGQVESGFAMTSYTLDPSQFVVDGPAEVMGGINELPTELVDLEGRREDFSLTVNILNIDPRISIRGGGSSEFYGSINRMLPVRNILDVPIVITGLMEGFTGELETLTGSINLEGENQMAVDDFVPAPDFLMVDCYGISEPGDYILRVLTGEAVDISFMVEPMEVTIRIIQVGD